MLDLLLQQYALLLENLNTESQKVLTAVPEIPCRKACYDCCKQLFPLSLMEAFYINEGFRSLPRKDRRELSLIAKKMKSHLDALDLAQHETFSNSLEDIAQNRNELTHHLQSTKTDCPLLGKDKLCRLYPYRNHDCRIHGISLDPETKEIVGCARHSKIFTAPALKQKFHTHALSSVHLYKEKSKLDSLLTTFLSGNEDLKYCYYFTTTCTPLLKDFREFDWPTFFEKKLEKKLKNNDKKYSLIIDLDVHP